ncbi:phosphoserine phosphatase SerB [Sphingomonas sp. 28-63-12]|uniref:phosphoserine phosphatase SerB n=1 Tax=Sphingomonas sp. 28-63-12 TaxID=1970434 RepID=UPI000BC5FE5A|nr:MAG: phosphoserine phosphatase SerB [Sphingomonas sp. 28-63-12]
MFIATLIAADRLDAGQISDALDRLNAAGCVILGSGWIDEGRAADLMFGQSPDRARSALEAVFDRVDVVVQPMMTRPKSLLIADMDSTMITVECIDELADYAGIKPQIAAVTEAAMRGEIDFGAALDARVALLAGLDEAVIEQCLAERVQIMPGAIALVRTMRARRAKAILVSGGFTRFAEPIGLTIGFDQVVANRLGVANGKLDGRVDWPIVDSTTKEATLLAAIATENLPPEATMAVGDGANDLAMIRRAGLGYAYHAKPVVAAAAAVRIDHNDLTALLYAQGIPAREWVVD